MQSNIYTPNITFGIITAGKRNQMLNTIVESIEALGIPKFEIIVSGNVTEDIKGTISVPYPEAAFEGRLGAMRNRILDHARYDIIVIGDDDITYDSNFYKALRQYGDNYDVMCPRILNADGSRYWDWAVYGSPTGHHMIPYNQDSEYCYVTGGMCILKKTLTEKVRWNADLGFYENEDISFSKILKDAGYKLKCNPQAVVIHNDNSITQIEDFNAKIPNEDWVTHSSGLRLRGAFLGDPHRFSVSDVVDIEVPTDLVDADFTIKANISLISHIGGYYPPLGIASIYHNEIKLGEINLQDEGQPSPLTLDIKKSPLPTVITITSSGLTTGAWNLGRRCRNIESFLISDLSLFDSDGKQYLKWNIPKREIQVSQPPYRGKKVKGMRLVSPLTCGNVQTRLALAMLPLLEEKKIELSWQPQVCTQESIIELRTIGGPWAKLITNNVVAGTRIELIDSNRVAFDNYFKRQAELWNGKNYSLIFDKEEVASITSDQLNSFESTLNISSMGDFKDYPFFVPYKFFDRCKSLDRLVLDYRPSKLIAFEISPFHNEQINEVLEVCRKLHSSLESLSILILRPEPHFWSGGPSLMDSLREAIMLSGIPIESLPPLTPVEGQHTDPQLFNIYREVDIVVNLTGKSCPLSLLPALTAEKPIINLNSDADSLALRNLNINQVSMTDMSSSQVEQITNKIFEIFDRKSHYDDAAKDALSTYIENDGSKLLCEKIISLHVDQ